MTASNQRSLPGGAQEHLRTLGIFVLPKRCSIFDSGRLILLAVCYKRYGLGGRERTPAILSTIHNSLDIPRTPLRITSSGKTVMS